MQSSAAVEQIVANIAAITLSLEKSDNMVKNLAATMSEGKSTLLTSNTDAKDCRRETKFWSGDNN
ncbi:MAG: hypothetical protein ACTTKL_03690 [Treponema sp.]